MGGTTGLSQEQLLALDRIARLPQAKDLHLAFGSAIAVYFGHRRSEDLDLFSLVPDVDLHADPIFPRGMTPVLWTEVRMYFAREAPRLLQELTQP